MIGIIRSEEKEEHPCHLLQKNQKRLKTVTWNIIKYVEYA